VALTVLTAATARGLTTAAALFQDTGDVRYLEEPSLTQALIAQASAAIESWCGRIFAQQRYVELDRGRRTEYWLLSQTPLVAVESVLIGTDTITDSRIDAAEAGILLRREGWSHPGEDVTVTYVAGYILPEQTTPAVPTGPVLPAELERACLETTKIWFAERLPESRIEARTLGDQTIRYGLQTTKRAIPALATSVLFPHRRAVLR
jgi:hypothetical protein